MTIVYIVGVLAVCVTLLLTVAMVVREVGWKRLDNRFHEIQKAFASDDPAVRAVAALQLGEMALIYCPRKVSSVVTEDYPFLQRAASQFAVALNVETHIKVRTALAEAIMTLLNFAEYGIKGLPTDHLIDTFINANLTALESFIKSLARYSFSLPNEDLSIMIEKCALVSPFCGDDTRINREIVQVLCATERFKAEIEVLREMRTSLLTDDEQSKNNTMLLSNVQIAADCLIKTRDTLARSLNIRKGNGSPRLEHQFLAGAEFRRKDYVLSHCEGAFLIGTNLSAAMMNYAYFDNAFLTFANMSNSELIKASFLGADLKGANFDKADLAFAELASAKVAMSNLNNANTVSASWKKANFYLGDEQDKALYENMLTKFGNVPDSDIEEDLYWGANIEGWNEFDY